jgi:hypothetical protein
MKNLILSLFCLVGFTSAAQLPDGTYYMSNGINDLKVEICEGGLEICEFSINLQDTLKLNGTGEWFAVNMNAFRDEEYDGPDGWYEITIDDEVEHPYIGLDVDYIKNCLVLRDPYSEARYELHLK